MRFILGIALIYGFVTQYATSGSHFRLIVACSRLRDGGGKSFSNKKCEKRAEALERFPKSCASYFRFARFNTFALYYLRAWHRLAYSILGKLLFS